MSVGTLVGLLKDEWFLTISAATAVVFLLYDKCLLGNLDNRAWLILILAWLLAVMLGSALSVVRHADRLAERLGEPYGTLILTLSVTSIEVMSISAVMMHGANNPTLVRDTLFAVVMIVMNGMVGLSLLFGALRHREQSYNLQGANAYLSVVIPLAVLTMILPDFTVTTSGPTLSRAQQIVLALTSAGLYAAFLGIQTGRHRGYFALVDEKHAKLRAAPNASRPMAFHAIMVAAYLLPVIFLSEKLAVPVDYLIETLNVPVAFGGAIMAILVATPEAIGAVRAATANHLQRSVNIFLGSVLSTIGLTVPAMIVVSFITGRQIALGLQHTDQVMLVLTLTVSILTFANGRTNVLQGAVHLILFVTYVLLMFQG